jgi:hypothetical protein
MNTDREVKAAAEQRRATTASSLGCAGAALHPANEDAVMWRSMKQRAEAPQFSGRWYIVARVLTTLWALGFAAFTVAFSREYPPLDPSAWVRGGVYAWALVISFAPLAIVVSAHRWLGARRSRVSRRGR